MRILAAVASLAMAVIATTPAFAQEQNIYYSGGWQVTYAYYGSVGSGMCKARTTGPAVSFK
jgi:hypothetical protein